MSKILNAIDIFIGMVKRRSVLDYKMNDIQTQIFTGHMLGDGWTISGIDCVNAKFGLKRKTEDKNYLEWSYEIFKDLCGTEIKDRENQDKRTGKTYYSSSFKTLSTLELTKYHKIWHNENNIKTIPANLELTPLILSVWFCDDGNIRIKSGVNAISEISIATDGFSRSDVDLLVNKINMHFGIKFKIYTRKPSKRKGHASKESYSIHITNKKDVLYFAKIVDAYIPESMNRKARIWRENLDYLKHNIKTGPKPKDQVEKRFLAA